MTQILLTGVLLGLEQIGLFFLLQGRVSSSILTYLAVTLAWLAGTAVGLLLPRPERIGAWRAAGLAAYYLVAALAALAPYDLRLLPLYGLLTAVTGAYAGLFFRHRYAAAGDARRLFFVENNGFILGMIGATLGIMLFGLRAAVAAPMLAAAALVLLEAPPEPNERRPVRGSTRAPRTVSE
jgi:hypothetical protein